MALPNPSIERTSTGQTRYSGAVLLLSCGWLVAAAHVERYAAGSL
ncbi:MULTISPECIES: hypothetical protein [Cyanophyceae]|nr:MULTISPECIES: hypothetical protein [Cyanophyceae]